MKVLQTLGEHRAKGQTGIFQYRRTAKGVEIDPGVGQAATLQSAPPLVLTHQQWTDILEAIASAKLKTFRIQRSVSGKPPKQDLDTLIRIAVSQPTAGGPWNTSLTSYVVAVLEHEGSIDLFGGSGGPSAGHPIVLRRDI